VPPVPPAEQRTVSVPCDHFAADGPRFDLPYLVCGALLPGRPTVLVVGDGQQFYITPENFPTLRREFGDAVNLVGLKRLLSAGG
jgi:hypothetical protein